MDTAWPVSFTLWESQELALLRRVQLIHVGLTGAAQKAAGAPWPTPGWQKGWQTVGQLSWAQCHTVTATRGTSTAHQTWFTEQGLSNASRAPFQFPPILQMRKLRPREGLLAPSGRVASRAQPRDRGPSGSSRGHTGAHGPAASRSRPGGGPHPAPAAALRSPHSALPSPPPAVPAAPLVPAAADSAAGPARPPAPATLPPASQAPGTGDPRGWTRAARHQPQASKSRLQPRP